MSVLSVMDTDARVIALYADTCSAGGLRQRQWLAHLERHDEARAAVAELIEADKEFDAARLSGNAIRIGEATARRAAALARVGGAS